MTNTKQKVNTLSALEQILEWVIYLQLKVFCNKNIMFTPYQSGFKEKHSCKAALELSLNDCKISLDTTKVIFDFKRAFETANPTIIMRKYGIPNVI